MGLSKLIKKSLKAFNPVGYANHQIKGAIGGLYKSRGGSPGDGGGQAALEAGYANALANQQSALGMIPKAFDKARSGLATGKSNAITNASRAGTVATAQTDQSLASRGLYNTTVLDNARQGVSAGVSRQVADIEAQYAQLEAELGLRQNAAENQIRGNIAQLNVGRGQAIAGHLTQQQAFAQQWALANDPNAWLDSLLGIGGTALGAYIGKKL